MKKEDLRILLIQARTADMADHEFSCVLKKTGMDEAQFVRVDAVKGRVDPGMFSNYDSVFIGGSGDYCVSDRKNDPSLAWLDPVFELVRQATAARKPILGICFGAHIMGEALGGEVRHDPEKMEVGTYVIEKLPNGNSDPLFFDMPNIFDAQCGRKDIVAIAPPGSVVLARSERAPIHAFSVGNGSYGIQFHPELDQEDLHDRLEYYRNLYVDQEDIIQAIMDSSRPTPDAAALVNRYVERILLEKTS